MQVRAKPTLRANRVKVAARKAAVSLHRVHAPVLLLLPAKASLHARVVNTKTDRNVRLELKVKQGQSVQQDQTGQQGRSVLRNQNGQTSLLAKIALSVARHHHLICSVQVSPAWSASGWK